MSRPKDAALNRWNFIFAHDVKTTTNLEKDCDQHDIKQPNNLKAVSIYQEGGDPLWGIEFEFNDDTK